MKKCEYCGSFMEDDAKFCEVCGTALKDNQYAAEPNFNGNYNSRVTSMNSSNPLADRNNWIKLAFAAMVLLVIGVGVYFGFRKYQDSKEKDKIAENRKEDDNRSSKTDSEKTPNTGENPSSDNQTTGKAFSIDFSQMKDTLSSNDTTKGKVSDKNSGSKTNQIGGNTSSDKIAAGVVSDIDIDDNKENSGYDYQDQYEQEEQNRLEQERLEQEQYQKELAGKNYSDANAILNQIQSEVSQGKQDGYADIYDQYYSTIITGEFTDDTYNMKSQLYTIVTYYDSYCSETGDDDYQVQNREYYKNCIFNQIDTFRQTWQYLAN